MKKFLFIYYMFFTLNNYFSFCFKDINDACLSHVPTDENDCLGKKSDIGICCYLGYKLNGVLIQNCNSVYNKAVFLEDVEKKMKDPNVKELKYNCDPDNSVIDNGADIVLDDKSTTYLYYFNSISNSGSFSLTSKQSSKYMTIFFLSSSGANSIDYVINNGKNQIQGYLYSYNSMIIPKDFYSGKKIDISFVCTQKCYFMLNIFFNETSYFRSYLKTEFNLVPEFYKMVNITFHGGQTNHDYFSYIYSQKKSKELDFIVDNKKVNIFNDEFFNIKFGEFSLDKDQNISLNIQSENNDVLTISCIANSLSYDPELFLTDYTFMGYLKNDSITYELLSDKNESQVYQIRITANKKISARFEREEKIADEQNMVIFQYNTIKSPYSLTLRKYDPFPIYRIQLLEVTDNSKSDNWIDPLILNVNSPDILAKDGVKYYPLDISNRKKNYRYIFTIKANTTSLNAYLTKCKTFPDCVYTISTIKKIDKTKASRSDQTFIIKAQEETFDVNDILLVECDDSKFCEYNITVTEEYHKNGINWVVILIIFISFLVLLAVAYFFYIHYFNKNKTVLIEDIGNLVMNENKTNKDDTDTDKTDNALT